MNRACTTEQEETVETLRVEYEAVQNQLKEDRNRLQAMVESQSHHSNPWWDLPIEDMSLDNLQHFKTSLENLKFNLVAAVQGKPLTSSVPPMPSSMVCPMPYTTVPPQQWC
uniref:Agamous-like MADS-box protein AGL62 n=2 Tax=Cajanus cajan TaxID=3821 RepID=A0A151QTV3_CAJCA|nr:hypothetical protein KK1_045432 [Cajanus cajan]